MAFAVTILINFFAIKQKFEVQIRHEMKYFSKHISTMFDSNIQNSSEKFSYLINSNEMAAYYINEQQKIVYNLFKNYKKTFPIITLIDPHTKKLIISEKEGKAKNSILNIVQKEIEKNKLHGMKKNKVYISKVKYSKELHKSIVLFSYSKRNYFDEDIAEIYGIYLLKDIYDKNLTFRKNYNILLLDETNRILLSNEDKEIGEKLLTKNKLFKNKLATATINKQNVYYYTFTTQYGKVLITLPYKSFLDLLFHFVKILIAIYLLVLLLAIIVSYKFSKNITNPIKNLLDQVLEYKSGNYHKKIKINTDDELGILSNAFDELGEELYQSKKELLEINKNLEKRVAYEVKEKTKAAKLAVKAKDEFLSNMSHEIRTPLNAIVGFIDLLRENETDTKKLKFLNIMESSSNSLLGIINDILDFSKIENNMLSIEYIDFNPNSEFKNIKKLFKAKLQEKNLRLFSSYSEMPSSLKGDPLRIKQVISNLISNAVKFTAEGKNIYIDMIYDKGYLNVNVKDEGIGINKEYLKNIFNPFTQADNSTTRKYGGSGLGLAISYQLVKLMGGELKVKSEEGKGSEFYFSIPLKIGKMIKIQENTTSKEQFNAYVLLVEDNKANQLFMEILLKKYGLKYDIANDGSKAVEKYKQNRYDMILMDENMPNMNGIEATKEIIEYEKQNNLLHTPIIALTANALKGDKEKFLHAGMDEYLSKPLNKTALINIFRKFL